jgi:hypothetical protein
MKMHQLGQKMEIDSRKLMMLKRMTTKTMTYPHPLLPNVQLRPTAHGASPKAKKEKKTIRDGLMKRLVDDMRRRVKAVKNQQLLQW